MNRNSILANFPTSFSVYWKRNSDKPEPKHNVLTVYFGNWNHAEWKVIVFSPTSTKLADDNEHYSDINF